MARNVVREPVAAGSSISDVRQRQATQEAFDRALPSWLRSARLLDNGGAGYAITPGTPLQIAHKLERQHKGWFLLSFQVPGAPGGAPSVWELVATSTGYSAAISGTHIQLDASEACTVKLGVF